MELNNATAIITGGGSGMGAATAKMLAAQGVKVALVDRDIAKAEALAKELKGVAYECDVSSAEQAEAVVKDVVEKHGNIRVLVNCAGIGFPGLIIGKEGPADLENFKMVINVNLVGTFNFIRLVANAMNDQEMVNEDGEKGVIVNTASVAAFEGQIGQSSYSASKAGIVALTLVAARELARSGVRVVTIAPGLVTTPMSDMMPDKNREALMSNIQFPKRFAHADEFAKLVLHIVDNAYLNGEVIRLDGAIRMPPK